MQSAIQIVLIVSVASLTIIFVTVGVWVVLILREVRRILNNLDQVSEDVSETTEVVKEKVKQGLSAVTILTALGALWSKRENVGELIEEIRGKNEAEKTELEKNKQEKEENKEKRKRRFFKRS